MTDPITIDVPKAIDDDRVLPFQIESSRLRGRAIKLGPALDGLLSQHGDAYPEPVLRLLGEAVLVARLLASNLKFDGIFTLQLKGDGPVRQLVADSTSEGVVRGYASFDADQVAAAVEQGVETTSLAGKGYLALSGSGR